MSCGRISEQHVGVLEGPRLGLGGRCSTEGDVLAHWEGGGLAEGAQGGASRTLSRAGPVPELGVGVGVTSRMGRRQPQLWVAGLLRVGLPWTPA